MLKSKVVIVFIFVSLFVLQTSLNDFYVTHQMNAYTDDVSKAARIYSEAAF